MRNLGLYLTFWAIENFAQGIIKAGQSVKQLIAQPFRCTKLPIEPFKNRPSGFCDEFARKFVDDVNIFIV